MFAIPGIIGLLFFIYLRPQEAIERLQEVPFLYLFFGLTCFGVAVDLRLRVSKAMALPHLPWAVLFYFWALISVAISAPEGLLRTIVLFGVTVVIFLLVAEGLQTFRVMEVVAAWLAMLCLCLAMIGVHQGQQPLTCIVLPDSPGSAGSIIGTPDGRPCERVYNCYEGDPEPGADYWCERPGLLGTHTVSGRVRYRGVLQDPNELSLAIGAGFALAIALYQRRRSRRWLLFLGVSAVFSGWCVYYTGSRSGQLVLLAVVGVFLLWRYRWKAVATLGPVALPVLAYIAAGGSRADAEQSTVERYEAWRTGLDLVRQSPIWGVGQGQFTQHHYLTAHNTYVLVFAELGVVGLFIFSMLIFVSVKTAWVGMRRYRERPEAKVAELWGVALLAAFAAIFAGATFLSFAYHYILWIYIGLTAAYYGCCKLHDPDFQVQVTFFDMMLVLLVDLGLYVVLDVFLRLKGF